MCSRTRAHILLSKLPVHRLSGPPGNAHLCRDLLPHLVLESNMGVSLSSERRIQVRQKVLADMVSNKGTDGQNEVV
jgi:hypothetical protein